MRQKLIEHGVRTGIVLVLLIIVFTMIHVFAPKPDAFVSDSLQEITELSDVDLNDPLHRIIARETHNRFIPDRAGEIDSVISQWTAMQNKKSLRDKRSDREQLSMIGTPVSPWLAWIKFVIIYVINLIFLFYAIQTLGLVRFIRYKQRNPTFVKVFSMKMSEFSFSKSMSKKTLTIVSIIKTALIKNIWIILRLILFTPAYIVAYTFRTNFNTDSVIFMIGLGCFTNGILIMYSQKYYQLLMTEYRKGYVETALTNQLSRDFSFRSGSALSWKSVFAFRKSFGNHVLQPVVQNARFQYLSAFREQASFLISCMIIIEMALNIHGHLGYELLQRLLFRDYFTTGAMIFGIFIIVKGTELLTDFRILFETQRHSNL